MGSTVNNSIVIRTWVLLGLVLDEVAGVRISRMVPNESDEYSPFQTVSQARNKGVTDLLLLGEQLHSVHLLLCLPRMRQVPSMSGEDPPRQQRT